MTPEDRSHTKELLDIQHKRLRVLELQVAQFGLYAPPHLLIEIEDLKKEIKRREQLLGIAADTSTSQPSSSTTIPSEQRTLTGSEVTRLVELLLATPSIADRGTRESILQLLPGSINNSILRSDNPRADILNIVRTALNYPNGLNELLDQVRWFEGNSLPMQKIDLFMKSLS